MEMHDDTDPLAIRAPYVSFHQFNIPRDPEEFQSGGDLVLPAIAYLACCQPLQGQTSEAAS